AFVDDRVARERLRGALAERAALSFAPAREAPRAAVGAAEDARLIVIEVPNADWHAAAAIVACLRNEFVDLPIVAYAHVSPELGTALLALARAGVSDIVLAGVDDTRARLGALLVHASGWALA